MSTKTFKSFVSAGRFIEVKKNGDGTNLTIYKGPSRSNSYLGISVTPTDAPALALAILEAAGVEVKSFAESNAAEMALSHLREHVGIEAAKAKEAADREALESEAWALFKAWNPGTSHARFGDVPGNLQTDWTRVARKSREMYGATS